jgi:hypothetical protein
MITNLNNLLADKNEKVSGARENLEIAIAKGKDPETTGIYDFRDYIDYTSDGRVDTTRFQNEIMLGTFGTKTEEAKNWLELIVQS